MKILYRNSKIKKLCTDEKFAIRNIGFEVTNKLFSVLNLIEASKNLKDILVLPQYKLHSLKGNRNDQYSIYLGKKTGFRLILIPLDENENVINSNDMNLYVMAVCVELLEVSKHYE